MKSYSEKKNKKKNKKKKNTLEVKIKVAVTKKGEVLYKQLMVRKEIVLTHRRAWAILLSG